MVFSELRWLYLQKLHKRLELKMLVWLNKTNSEEFITWFNTWTFPNSQINFRHVELSCNSGNGGPGDVIASDADVLFKLVQRYSLDKIRLTLSQTLLLPYVNIADMTKVFEIYKKFMSNNIACCPGLDYCSKANARTIAIAKLL